jgi:6-phosphogluconolactonase/glucosamine-6-phosphate isomerase/deaminase
VFTVAGADKADAFARVQAGDDVPAARVEAERVIWLVDPAAVGTR